MITNNDTVAYEACEFTKSAAGPAAVKVMVSHFTREGAPTAVLPCASSAWTFRAEACRTISVVSSFLASLRKWVSAGYQGLS